MRSRLFLMFLILLCFSFVSAQRQPSGNRFEVSLVVEKPEIVWTAKTAIIKVKLTNLTNRLINPTPNLMVRLEKQLDGPVHDWETESADVSFPENVIGQGKSIEFDVDLKKVGWNERSSSSSFELNSQKEPYSPLLIGWYYIYITIAECLKTDNAPNVLLNSEFLSCNSEKVLINFKPFDFN